jgi:PEP-CTERM motif-containing protein
MKAITLCAIIAGMVTTAATAATVTWGSPTTISGASDVSTLGTTVGTWGPGDDWGGVNRSDNYPVNGVTFAAYGGGPFASFLSSSGLDDRYGSYGNPGTADANYNYLLQTAIYSNGSSISLSWGGMTAGDTYLLQFWAHDGRNSTTAERSETLTGGANTSAALAYGFGSTGPGQYIVGRFVADGTGTQTITLNAFGGNDIGPSAQINLLQLRDITPVPEPSSLAMLAVGASALVCGFRRKSNRSEI